MGQGQTRQQGDRGGVPEHDHSGNGPCPACLPENLTTFESDEDRFNAKLFQLLQESNAIELSHWLDDYVVIGEDVPDLSVLDPDTPLGRIAEKLRIKLRAEEAEALLTNKAASTAEHEDEDVTPMKRQLSLLLHDAPSVESSGPPDLSRSISEPAQNVAEIPDAGKLKANVRARLASANADPKNHTVAFIKADDSVTLIPASLEESDNDELADAGHVLLADSNVCDESVPRNKSNIGKDENVTHSDQDGGSVIAKRNILTEDEVIAVDASILNEPSSMLENGFPVNASQVCTETGEGKTLAINSNDEPSPETITPLPPPGGHGLRNSNNRSDNTKGSSQEHKLLLSQESKSADPSDMLISVDGNGGSQKLNHPAPEETPEDYIASEDVQYSVQDALSVEAVQTEPPSEDMSLTGVHKVDAVIDAGTALPEHIQDLNKKNLEDEPSSQENPDIRLGLSRRSSGRSSGMPDGETLSIGDRVLVAGQRRGIIRYTGETDFAPGWWYGIELDRPVGKNDGSVNNRRYFTCKPKFGVFAPPSRAQRIDDSMGEDSFDLMTTSMDERQHKLAARKKWRRIGPRGVGGSQPILCGSPGRPKSALIRPKSSGSSGSLRRSLSVSAGSEFKLQEGMSVFCNNELGTIRYIGPVEFAEGIWLGVELRTPKGKNDGSVQGNRYFTCKPNYGLIVRPSKVTVRGINGAKLLGDNGDKL